MPVPSTINDLSTTAGANYPAGTESPSTIDDYLRAHASFIATLRDGKVGDTGDETIAGIKTFSSTIVGNISGNAGTATSATTATNLAGGSAGTLPYQTGSGATAQLAAGTSGFVLRCNGAAAPSWTAQSAIDAGSVDGKSFGTFGAAGGILYATSTTDASATVAGTSGQVLLSGGAGAPTWAAQSSLSVGSATTSTSATSATTATNIAGGAAGAVPYQSGAGSTSLLAAGTSGQVLQSNGAGAPSWVNQSTLTAGNVSGVVAVANGGTGTSNGSNLVPVGAVVSFAMGFVPTGWLMCDGSAVSRSTYANLFAAIGTLYGAGDGSTTFNIPDLRGEFVRGYDNGRGVDPGRWVGNTQGDQIGSHTHTYDRPSVGGGAQGAGGNASLPLVNGGSATGATGGGETRPRNVALLYCIKT